jgi:hypothetical protein
LGGFVGGVLLEGHFWFPLLVVGFIYQRGVCGCCRCWGRF